MEINYFLIEANKIKLGGYAGIKYSFLVKLVDFLYPDGVGKERLQYKYRGYMGKTYTGKVSVDNYPIPASTFVQNIVNGQRYLLTSEDPLIAEIYLKARVNPAYKEFAFILFLVGAVNSYDYLKCFTDVNDVTSRFTVSKYKCKGDDDIFRPLMMTNKQYANLMGMYLVNTSNGVDYGFSAYDFVYHILNSMGAKNKVIYSDGNKFEDSIKFIKGLKIGALSCFSLNKGIVSKYTDEVGVMLPIISGALKPNVRDNVIMYVLKNGRPDLAEAILRDPDFIKVNSMNCLAHN